MAWSSLPPHRRRPVDPLLAGPSSFGWVRRLGEDGRVGHVTTDGGVTAPPPDEIIRQSRCYAPPPYGTVSSASHKQ